MALMTTALDNAQYADGIVSLYVAVSAQAGSCKIGHSIDAKHRVRTIASATGLKDLYLFAAIPILRGRHRAREIEKETHRSLWRERIHGEWFSISPDKAVDAIERSSSIIALHWEEWEKLRK